MKIIKLSFIFATLTIAVFVFGGCRPEVVTVDSVTVRPSTVEITVDSSCQLSATIQPSDAPQDLEWFSSQPSVATVTPSGLVSAIAPGECDITASAGDKRGVCHVRVVSPVPSDPENPNNPDEPQNQNQVGFDEVGASYALFSVADGHTVHFSRGNLQYMANPQSKDKGIWRFAEHQYDFIGAASANASEFYDGWIDGFCWGTSGWNSGANEPHR